MTAPEMILWGTLGAMVGYSLFLYGVVRLTGFKPFGKF